MSEDADPLALVESTADERLLGPDQAQLPDSVGRPERLPATRARQRIVAVGAGLTGTTLLVGGVLLVAGAVEALWAGTTALGVALVALGLLLVGTHWGWVHVAELAGSRIEGRRDRELAARHRSWLEAIKPYTRYEVTTSVGDDGAIVIARVRYRPVRSGEARFTFVRETESTEVHSAEAPGASVAERAELLRRQAALDTARELARFESAVEAHQGARFLEDEEEESLAARRAASEALSERINTNLRDPPLLE